MKGLLKKSMDECVRLSEEVVRCVCLCPTYPHVPAVRQTYTTPQSTHALPSAFNVPHVRPHSRPHTPCAASRGHAVLTHHQLLSHFYWPCVATVRGTTGRQYMRPRLLQAEKGTCSYLLCRPPCRLEAGTRAAQAAAAEQAAAARAAKKDAADANVALAAARKEAAAAERALAKANTALEAKEEAASSKVG